MKSVIDILLLIKKLFFGKKTKKKKKSGYGIVIALTAMVTAILTTLAIAFVPTIVKVNKGKGFDAYGFLSHLKVEKKTKANGKVGNDVKLSLIDLDRYAD